MPTAVIPNIVKKKWQWFEEALIPTRSVSGDLLVVFCGNVIARDCCVTRAGAKADHWDIVNIRDAEGRSTWPEKNTEERIRRIEQTISTKAFQQEYMNNPLSEGEVIKEVIWGKCPPMQRLQFAVAYADPSPSNARNKASSFKAVFCSVTATGHSTSIRDFSTMSPTTSSWTGSTTCAIMRANVCRFITSSRTTACRILSMSRCSSQCSPPAPRERGFIGITPDCRCKPPKFERIEGNLEPLIRQGRLVLNIDERENPHMKRLEEQFLLLNRQMKSPADGPDCIEGGVWIINQKISTLNEGSYTIGQRVRASKRF